MSVDGRGPGIDVPPPTWFALAYLIAWLLDRYVVHLWPTMPHETARSIGIIGWVLIVTGMSLAMWGRTTFTRLKTPVYPNRDARLLVVEGPYRFSRNPMYTGIIIACIGGCSVLASLWPLITVSVATVILYHGVIRREERYLTDEFGDDYREYQRHVGRWFTL